MPTAELIETLRIIEPIPGWYGREGAVMNEFFLDRCLNAELGMAGDLAEIGVFEGRSATHLARQLAAGQTLHLFDLLERVHDVAERIRPLLPAGTAVRSHRLLSQMITGSHLADASLRFIRIDAMHTRKAIRNDLAVAHRTLAENGIVNLDDMFHVGMAGVTFGAIEWLVENRGAFEMLLVGFGQAYLCRPSFVSHYMDEMRWLPELMRGVGVTDFSFVRQSAATDCLTVGIHHRLHDRDWLMHETDYSNPEGPTGRRLEY